MLTLLILFTIIIFYTTYKYINVERNLLLIFSGIFLISFLLYCVSWNTLFDIKFFSENITLRTFVFWYAEEILKLWITILTLILYKIVFKKNLFSDYFVHIYFLSTLSFLLLENYLYYLGFITSWSSTSLSLSRAIFSSCTHLSLFLSIILLWRQNWIFTVSRLFYALLIAWFLHWLSNSLLTSGIVFHMFLTLIPFFFLFWHIWDNSSIYIKNETDKFDTRFSVIITILFFFFLSPANFTDKNWDSSFITYTSISKILWDYIDVGLVKEDLRVNILQIDKSNIESRKQVLLKYRIDESNLYYKRLLNLTD